MKPQIRDFTDLRPNPALRRLLRDSGHDLCQWSDRHLVALQVTAQQLAAGQKIFVSAQMRPLLDTLMAKAVQEPR